MFDGQLDTDADGYLKTHDYVFTRVHGVLPPATVQDRRYRQAITAAGSGCMAAIEVEKFLEEQEGDSGARPSSSSGLLFRHCSAIDGTQESLPSTFY